MKLLNYKYKKIKNIVFLLKIHLNKYLIKRIKQINSWNNRYKKDI